MSSPIKGPFKSVLPSHREDAKYPHILSQSDEIISPTWILLYNQSTLDVFLSKNLLRSFRKANRDLVIFLAGGNTMINLVGYLHGYWTVWFHLGVISNKLSLSKVAEKYRVFYDSTNGK